MTVHSASDLPALRPQIIAAQKLWAARPLVERLAIFAKLRPMLVMEAESLASGIDLGSKRAAGQSIIYEILPLADALQWLVRQAPEILKSRVMGKAGLPQWLGKLGATTHYDPHGIIGILAPFNYPLYLPGVQLLQALAAGNAVIVKPAATGIKALVMLQDMLRRCGLPDHLFTLTTDDLAAAEALLQLPPDKIILTGSATTGRKVLAELAKSLTPSVMELSGNDAVIVLPDAAADLVLDALRFGLLLNGGATCIAPRRLFLVGDAAKQLPALLTMLQNLPVTQVTPAMATEVTRLQTDAIQKGAAIHGGTYDAATGRLQPLIIVSDNTEIVATKADIFAPVLTILQVADETALLKAMAQCPYALGASIFGMESAAIALGTKLQVGCVTINDLVAPTADPRLSFGGRGASGFGKTRGQAGLLEMVVEKTVIANRNSLRPHYAAPEADDPQLFLALHHIAHGTAKCKIKAIGNLLRIVSKRKMPKTYRATH